nr:sigma 54-interacting transcriptional regulator [Bacilli bacterium]
MVNWDETLRAMYDFLVEQLDEGVHVIDASGKTVIYNAKMASIESMLVGDVLDKKVQEVFSFPKDGYSTLLYAVQTGATSMYRKQTYYNGKGEVVTTLNKTMPIVQAGEIIGAVEIARDITQIERIQENLRSREENPTTFATLIAKSEVMQAVILEAKRAARTNSSVLIVGETGTGKERFAQSIHQESPRKMGPFLTFNCASLPEDMVESVLFGTMHGAFPGAIDRQGWFEQGEGGTLLLDGLSALPLPLQTKLLRVLEEKTLRRLGDTVDRHVDVRVIATMHEDPLDAVNQGRLRKDLYYRLSVVTLFLPPLREHKEDIAPLTAFFLHRYNDLFGMQVQSVSKEIMHFFMTYPWHGNVRELENMIEGAMNLATDQKELLVSHLPMHVRKRFAELDDVMVRSWPASFSSKVESEKGGAYLHQQLAHYEKAYVLQQLADHDGNVSATARTLGVSRQSLQYRLRKWQVDRS